MKTPTDAEQAGRAAVPDQQHARSAADGRTRDEVVRLLLEHGPTTAGELAEQLGVSGPAVRRHLDALVGEGSLTTRDASRAPRRGRGRPARQYLLTPGGRARAGRGENEVADLAVAALRSLAETAGSQAVRAFARARVEALVGAHRAAVADADPEERVAALAAALSSEGYAASSRRATPAGEQLCQHHCPVAHVAAEFPQLCEAETEVFAELLGTHVQRLATIARGDAACTTHVPAGGSDAAAVEDPAGTTTTVAGPVVKGRQVV